jgi:hypothetical protein
MQNLKHNPDISGICGHHDFLPHFMRPKLIDTTNEFREISTLLNVNIDRGDKHYCKAAFNV